MKKKITVLAAGLLTLSLLVACGAGGTASGGADSGTADKTIVVGASPTPHAEILNAAKDILAEEGYTLEVKEFSDYVLPNTALSDGELDANFFQHIPYLEKFNEKNGTQLVSAIEMHYEPFAIYPGKTASLSELQDGATIAVPNDDTNETRALLLLQEQGLIKLKDGVDPTVSATALDIVENTHNYQIQELAAEQLPRALADVDIAVINGNYALGAGLSVADDALAVESEQYGSVYVNIVAVREGDQNSEKIKALEKALHSDTVKKFIEDTYKGAVQPVF